MSVWRLIQSRRATTALLWLAAGCAAPREPTPAPAAAPSPVRCTGELSFTHVAGDYPSGSACAAIDARWAAVGDAERACTHDADCRLVTGVCFAAALSAAAARDPRFAETPCPDPAGGMCPPDPGRVARCVGGCCIAAAP